MVANTTSLESLVSRFRAARARGNEGGVQFSQNDLDRLITNGANVGLNQDEVRFVGTMRRILSITTQLARQ